MALLRVISVLRLVISVRLQVIMGLLVLLRAISVLRLVTSVRHLRILGPLLVIADPLVPLLLILDLQDLLTVVLPIIITLPLPIITTVLLLQAMDMGMTAAL